MKRLFLIMNCVGKTILLISTFAVILDYKNQENYCKGPLFTYRCTSQRMKRLFLIMNCLSKTIFLISTTEKAIARVLELDIDAPVSG